MENYKLVNKSSYDVYRMHNSNSAPNNMEPDKNILIPCTCAFVITAVT